MTDETIITEQGRHVVWRSIGSGAGSAYYRAARSGFVGEQISEVGFGVVKTACLVLACALAAMWSIRCPQ